MGLGLGLGLSPFIPSAIGATDMTVLLQSTTPVSHTGDTTYTSVLSTSIPAGSLAVGDMFEIIGSVRMNGSFTDGANIWGGLDNFIGWALATFSAANGGWWVGRSLFSVEAAAKIVPQIMMDYNSGFGGSGMGTRDYNVLNSVDVTAAALPINLNVTLANAADTIVMQSYSVIRYRPA